MVKKETGLFVGTEVANAQHTEEALNAGFIWGYEGLINNIIKKITSKWKMKYKIILTGGYAKFFKKIISDKSM